MKLKGDPYIEKPYKVLYPQIGTEIQQRPYQATVALPAVKKSTCIPDAKMIQAYKIAVNLKYAGAILKRRL
jgi:hypothetical protein